MEWRSFFAFQNTLVWESCCSIFGGVDQKTSSKWWKIVRKFEQIEMEWNLRKICCTENERYDFILTNCMIKKKNLLFWKFLWILKIELKTSHFVPPHTFEKKTNLTPFTTIPEKVRKTFVWFGKLFWMFFKFFFFFLSFKNLKIFIIWEITYIHIKHNKLRSRA